MTPQKPHQTKKKHSQQKKALKSPLYPLTTNSNSLAKKSKWEEPHLSSSSCPPSPIQNLHHLITHLFLPYTQQQPQLQLQPTTTASENLPPQNLIARKFYPKSGDQSADQSICGSIDQSFRYCFFVLLVLFLRPRPKSSEKLFFFCSHCQISFFRKSIARLRCIPIMTTKSIDNPLRQNDVFQ